MANNTLDFKVNKLSITLKTNQTLDITSLFQEINFYDSIFSPCMSGKVLIHDSAGIFNAYQFDGVESLIVDIEKIDCTAKLKRNYVIYSKSDVKNPSDKKTAFVLNFVTKEYLNSKALTVNKTYRKTYTEIVNTLLKDELGIKSEQIYLIEPSVGVRDVVFSGKNPISCIFDCAKKAVNSQLSPTFMFFENVEGYNFISLSTLAIQSPLYTLNYDASNFTATKEQELFRIKKYEVKSEFNVIDNYNFGSYGSTAHLFNIAERRILINTKDGSSLDTGFNKLNPGSSVVNPYYNSAKSSLLCFPIGERHISGDVSGVVKATDSDSINRGDDSLNYIQQRPAQLKLYTNMRIRVIVPGNFDLTSGKVVNVKIPIAGMVTEDNSEDARLSGNYIIIASRHIIRFDSHQTILELGKDSAKENVLYSASSLQEDSAEEDESDSNLTDIQEY